MPKQEIQLIVPQFYNISRSFSRKVQVKQYEPVDFFSSHNESIPLEEVTEDKVKEISQKLYKRAQEDVERDIADYLNQAKTDRGEMATPNAKDIIAIADVIQKIVNSTPETIDEVTTTIADQKDKYTDTQLSILRKMILQIKNK